MDPIPPETPVIQKSQIVQQFEALSPVAQRQVAEFIAFLSARGTRRTLQPASRKPLRSEGFIGMWVDRDDLRDSTEWVRGLRSRDWSDRWRAPFSSTPTSSSMLASALLGPVRNLTTS
ncbi:MAG: hypothetical protein JWM27_2507 [Gemmatimonadetes bacterium]|nr:hypothetical protein [Gemmatimonadota bacterium]